MDLPILFGICVPRSTHLIFKIQLHDEITWPNQATHGIDGCKISKGGVDVGEASRIRQLA